MRLIHASLTAIILPSIFVLIGGGILFIAASNGHPSQIVRELYAMKVVSALDADHDGVDDYTDIVENARRQIGVVKSYDTSYYSGGYPPDNTGACSDVLWRALEGTGYDFKAMLDTDMTENQDAYPTKFDTNINFRRTQNILPYLERHAQSFTTKVIPNNLDNLKEWQGGDIVTFAQIPGGLWHVAIVSDKRQRNGVPYLIHNHGQGTVEDKLLTWWPTAITGHFRFLGE